MGHASCHGIVLSKAHHTIKRDKLNTTQRSCVETYSRCIDNRSIATHRRGTVCVARWTTVIEVLSCASRRKSAAGGGSVQRSDNEGNDRQLHGRDSRGRVRQGPSHEGRGGEATRHFPG